jgi:hypothetical protein
MRSARFSDLLDEPAAALGGRRALRFSTLHFWVTVQVRMRSAKALYCDFVVEAG